MHGRVIFQQNAFVSKMFSIWILNHLAITPNYPGGTRHHEIGMRLAQKDCNVTIFASSILHQTPMHNIIPDGRLFLIDSNSTDTYKFVWINSLRYKRNDVRRLLNMLIYSVRSINVTSILVKQGHIVLPDIIIGSTVHPFAALAAKRLARKYGAKYIFEIRDLWPQTFIDMGIWRENSFQSRFFRYLEKKCIQGAQGIIYLAPQTKTYLQQRYGVNERLTWYIPNGTNVMKPDNPKDNTEKFPFLDPQYFNALFTGSIIPTNRVDVICEAAQRLQSQSRIRIVVVGNGSEKDYLKNQYGNLSNLIWVDPVPKKDIPALLRSADALILVQGKVGWGSSNKLYDYLAAGRPIISSVWAKHNDVVTQVGAGVSVPSENAEALAKAIKHVAALPKSRRHEMGRKGIEFVKKYHDWDILAEKFLKAIQSVSLPIPEETGEA